MEILINDFYSLFTIVWLLTLINIIIIDIVMSWDNAIVIWMATKDLPEKIRKKVIMIWIFAATIMRVILSIFALYLLNIIWLKIAWWLLLLYVVFRLYFDITWWNHNSWDEVEENIKIKAVKKVTYTSAIITILIADLSMSLDNVLAVAWRAHWNLVALWIWLIFSIILMAFASNFIASKLNKYPKIQWIWLIIISIVAIQMIYEWSNEVENKLWYANVLIFSIFAWIILFLWVFAKEKKSKKS